MCVLPKILDEKKSGPENSLQLGEPGDQLGR
ncbi:hypothetical protein MYIN104542_22350 [Mycobacterium intermedium]